MALYVTHFVYSFIVVIIIIPSLSALLNCYYLNPLVFIFFPVLSPSHWGAMNGCVVLSCLPG